MNRCVVAILYALLIPLAGNAAPKPWVARSDENAKLLLEVMAKYSPENASDLGVESVDENITDLSRDTYEPMVADTQHVIDAYQKMLPGETDAKVRQDLDILIHTAQDQLVTAGLQRKYFVPYVDMPGLVFGAVRSLLDPRIPKARQQAVLARLVKYAGVAKGFRPIAGLSQERVRERLKEDPKLLWPFKDQVEQDIRSAPQFIAGMKERLAHSGLVNWEKPFALLEKQLLANQEWVKAEVLTHARADHRLPAEVYADNLKTFGVDISPEELIARALTSFSEIRNQMQITAGLIAKERGLPDADYRAVMRELKKQQLAPDQVLPTYTARLAQIEEAVRAHHIVTLPERKAVIRLATDAENAQIPAPHMNPPRLIGNSGEYGEFVLATGMPPDASGKQLRYDDFTHQAASWTLTAHEARPGHELQFAKMIESGVSTARAIFAFNSVNVEGWGLYAEAEMQPYEPLDGQLFAQQARMMRIARAFLDPMVNLGQIEPARVVSFLMEDVGLSEALAMQEMQRYVFRGPGQATSYFYGYQRLMETREAAEVALREKFDRQAFNDFVLSQGLVPPRLLRKAVMEEFVPAQLLR